MEFKKMSEFLMVDPAGLYLPTGVRSQGADVKKLARQIATYGLQIDGMPTVEVTRGCNGLLRINDGVTRATRAAKLRPGEFIIVEVIDTLPNLDVTKTQRVGDTI